MDILNLTALELAKEIRNGNVSCVDALKTVYEAYLQKDDSINAYVSFDIDSAIIKAEEIQKRIDKREIKSPLAGVPIAIKDNICVRGLKATCGSKMLENFVPFYNATVIDRLEQADMIVLGKTNMDEFAMGASGETSYLGPTKNPIDLAKIPGGSSSGSAAAIAGREAIIALGSDTGGSVRQPASYCGLFGFKPTYGLVSRYGLIAYASSFDQIGPITRDADDCMAIMNIISGLDPLDSTSLDADVNFGEFEEIDFTKVKIAIPKQCADINPITEKIKTLGAEIDYIDIPFFDYAVAAYYIIATAEASSNLSRYDGVKYGYKTSDYNNLTEMYRKTRSEGFGGEVKKRILLGTFVLSSGYFDAYYKKALKIKSLVESEFKKLFAKYDLVLTPTTVGGAPMLNELKNDSLRQYTDDLFTVPVNLAGLPAVSFPYGQDVNGLPLGVQLIGPKLSDAKVISAAKCFSEVV